MVMFPRFIFRVRSGIRGRVWNSIEIIQTAKEHCQIIFSFYGNFIGIK